MGTPLGSPHEALYEGLRRIRAVGQFEWIDGLREWVLSVSVDAGVAQMRVRAEPGTDVSRLGDSFLRAERELRLSGHFGPPFELVATDLGLGYIDPTDSLERPYTTRLFDRM